MKERTLIVVDCDTWIRGGNRDESLLLNAAGEKCCLGFGMLQLGDLNPNTIWMWGNPDGPGLVIPFLTDDQGRNSGFSEYAMRINDNPEITDHIRMKRLRALARMHGLQFRFTNQPEPRNA